MGAYVVVAKPVAIRIAVVTKNRDRVRFCRRGGALFRGDASQVLVHLAHRGEAVFSHARLARGPSEEAADHVPEIVAVGLGEPDDFAANVHGEGLRKILNEFIRATIREGLDEPFDEILNPGLERAHAGRHEVLAETAAKLGVLRRIHIIDQREHRLHPRQQMRRGSAVRVRNEVSLAGPPNIVEARERKGVVVRQEMNRGFISQTLVDAVVVAIDDFV